LGIGLLPTPLEFPIREGSWILVVTVPPSSFRGKILAAVVPVFLVKFRILFNHLVTTHSY
jgi:hypothetical protein